MPEELLKPALYLSYSLRGLALLSGAFLLWEGSKLLDQGRGTTQVGEIQGAWRSIRLILRNAPGGTVLVLVGAGLIAGSLMTGRFKMSTESPEGRIERVIAEGEGVEIVTAPASGKTYTSDSVRIDGVTILPGQKYPDVDSLLSLPVEDGIVEFDREYHGTLSASTAKLVEGRYLQAWSFETPVEDRVQIDLSSDDFDSYLVVVSESMDKIIEDDDSGDGKNSRSTLTAESGHEYRIIATTYKAKATGDYVLSVKQLNVRAEEANGR